MEEIRKIETEISKVRARIIALEDKPINHKDLGLILEELELQQQRLERLREVRKKMTAAKREFDKVIIDDVKRFNSHGNSKSVRICDKDGKEIGVFPSINEAAEKLKFDFSNFNRQVRSKSHARKYKFEYLNG